MQVFAGVSVRVRDTAPRAKKGASETRGATLIVTFLFAETFPLCRTQPLGPTALASISPWSL